MLFSYNWLQSFFYPVKSSKAGAKQFNRVKGKLPGPEKLADLLSRHFAEVEEVKKENKDFVLDIDVRPNRAGDCFSHLGIAREISAILNSKLKIENWKPIEDKNLKVKDFVSVEVKDKMACPRYTSRVVTDVKVGPSPKWLQERLRVCGLRPINNIVDIANYVMLETGQPLHAFDFFKIESGNSKFEIPNEPKKIIVRFAKRGEKIKTIDEEEYELDKDILVIADSKEPLAIAGIKGGKKAEITNQTKAVVLEAANFNQKIIRFGSRKIDLKTDASWRFEHGIDPNLTEMAINRAASLIQEIAKGKVTQGLIDVYHKKSLPKKIKLDLDYVERLLGVRIPVAEIKNILKRLGFKITRQFLIEIPTFRLDISIPEDLIEEIGRIYGYEKIIPKFPLSALVPPKRNLEIFWENMAKNILKEAGFNEVYNYSFVSEKDINLYQFNQHKIEIENPISAEYQYLRPSLIPNLLKNVQKNQRFFNEIRIFELGKVFVYHSNALREKRMLTRVMTGDSFFEVKGTIDFLLNKMGISDIWYDEYKPTPEESKISIWQKGKCAEIKVNGEEIGFLGEISIRILNELQIENKAVVFDIDFEKLQKLASEEHEFRPISPYPAAVRDIAVLVPREVRVEEVLNKIEEGGGELIRDVDLFDIYEGEEIPEGKKNLAFHIIYQSQDHPLTPNEISQTQNKIIRILEKEPEWQVRK
jgi:phenylalanyl-tRNA synthetase beta chain